MSVHLKMGMKERERMKVWVEKAELKLKDAAAILRICYRMVLRLWERYREEGDKGLVHRGPGRPSNAEHQQR